MTTSQILKGRTLSPGLGEGKTFVHRDPFSGINQFYDIGKGNIREELKRLEFAISRMTTDLTTLANRVEKEMDASLSAIFHAHCAMVQDPALRDEVETEIRQELVSASSAVKTVFRRWEQRFEAMDAEISREKSDDIRDLSRRLILQLAGIRGHALEHLPRGSVLVSERLLPSDTVFLAHRNAAAVLLKVGGSGSHAALFARELGLPCITGIDNLLEQVSTGQYALIDADTGTATLNPDSQQIQAFQKKCSQAERTRLLAIKHAAEPAITLNKVRVPVLANVGCKDDTQTAIANGAEGVGLFRIERIYLGQQKPPTCAELIDHLQVTLAPMGDAPVYVRLLDIGADKPLPYMPSLEENNPTLGLRGVRFLLEYPDLLKTQTDALAMLSKTFDLHILVPMVTLPTEMERVKHVLHESVTAAGLEKCPPLGTMIETPAAALSVKQLAKHADFFSIGTNDLTQYVFAADRENPIVDSYFDDTHDVIFELLETICRNAGDKPVSLCGELAGRPECVERILQCGVSQLSVPPSLVPDVKSSVRQAMTAIPDKTKGQHTDF